MYFFHGAAEKTFEIRTSDAIALSLRFGCPIFAAAAVLKDAGIPFESQVPAPMDSLARHKTAPPQSVYQTKEMAELKRLLEKAIRNEDYEKASLIRDEINQRKQR